jgi:hypothetical protein
MFAVIWGVGQLRQIGPTGNLRMAGMRELPVGANQDRVASGPGRPQDLRKRLESTNKSVQNAPSPRWAV